MCLILDESTYGVFHRGRTDVRKRLESTADCMSYVLDPVLDDESLIDYFVQLPQPFQDAMPADGKAQLMTHVACYDANDHETVSLISVSIKAHPLGVWICTQVYIMEPACDVSAKDTLARLWLTVVVFALRTLTIPSFPWPAHVRVLTDLEECLVVSIDTPKRTHDCVINGVIYIPIHTGDRYRDVPCDRMCFKDP